MYHAAMRSELARIEFFVSRWQIIPVKIESREHGLKSLYGEMAFSVPVFRDRPSRELCRYAAGNMPVLNFSVYADIGIKAGKGKANISPYNAKKDKGFLLSLVFLCMRISD